MKLKVVGVTKGNRQEVIRSIIDSYVEKGKLKSFEGLSDEDQVLKGIASLEKEPDNPHDPNAIKVMLNDAHGKKYHVGYIAKEQTAEVS
ncbi:HIRAN domain-containing protein, partial [Gracilibacillus dipsosauri]|uniref:HIRAN domain-containing protein n=1 Tax=Gracilibacillus dipsosauri TaxID=178340 RepID=UPI00240A2C10